MTAVAFPVAFRPTTPEDIGFVAKSWIESYHGGSETLRSVREHRYKREQRAVIRDALERGKCIVACEPADATLLYGFACGWDDIGVGVAHYVYVKHTRRQCGLARALIHELGTACGRTMTAYSHSTVQGAALARRLNLRHDPFALVRMIYASDGTVRGQGSPAPDGEGRERAAHPPSKRAAG